MRDSAWPQDENSNFLGSTSVRIVCACRLRQDLLQQNDFVVFNDESRAPGTDTDTIEEHYYNEECTVWRILLCAPIQGTANRIRMLVVCSGRGIPRRPNQFTRICVESAPAHVIEVSPQNIFWKSVHDCALSGCSVSSHDRKMIHIHRNRDPFIIWNHENGYPTRSG